MKQLQEINEPYYNNFEYIPSPGDDDDDPYGGIALNVSRPQQQTPDPVFPSIPAKGGVYSKTGTGAAK